MLRRNTELTCVYENLPRAINSYNIYYISGYFFFEFTARFTDFTKLKIDQVNYRSVSSSSRKITLGFLESQGGTSSGLRTTVINELHFEDTSSLSSRRGSRTSRS